MTSTVAQSVSFQGDAIVRKTSMKQWISEHAFAINIASLGLVVVMVALYIVQVNATISKGYDLRNLETQVHELTLMNEKMELETRQSQSLQHVTESIKMLGFVEAGMPEYVDLAGSSFALAD
ncbi:MAG: hypothetical protein P8J32_00385 [bacterium]|jgi:hypothetical protein|nr:hypothetical protein [bacterium]